METISEGDKRYCNTCQSEQIIESIEMDFGGMYCVCSMCGRDMDALCDRREFLRTGKIHNRGSQYE